MSHSTVHFHSYADLKRDIRRERTRRFFICWVIGVAGGIAAGVLLAMFGHVLDLLVDAFRVEDVAMLRLLLGGWFGMLFGGLVCTQVGLG